MSHSTISSSLHQPTVPEGQQVRKKHRTVLFLILSVAGAFSLILSVYAASKIELYYFNPDSVQSNFSHLTSGFGNFLKGAGLDASFQAFTQKVDFDRRIKDKRPTLVFVPSWYYQKYGESLGLTPLLISLENGKPNYTKILLVRKGEPFTVEGLKGKTVAMTTMGPNTEDLLNNSYFKEQGVDFSTMNIIVTPKDADALYALALGQVDAALVGQATLNFVGSANQRVLEITKELAASSPVPTPLLCSLPGTMDEIEINRLKQIFIDGGKESNLPQYMKMLHINGWKNAL